MQFATNDTTDASDVQTTARTASNVHNNFTTPTEVVMGGASHAKNTMECASNAHPRTIANSVITGGAKDGSLNVLSAVYGVEDKHKKGKLEVWRKAEVSNPFDCV